MMLFSCKSILSILFLELYILSGCTVHCRWDKNIFQGTSDLKEKQTDDNTAVHYRYDEASKTLHVPKLNVHSFGGNSLNFHGADLANVHLVNATIDGPIPHLTIDTIELTSEVSGVASGSRMAIFDPRGGLYTADGVKWDKERKVLEVNNISSLSSFDDLNVHSDIDMNLNTIRNFKLDEGTALHKVRVESSTIVDSTLVNATFEDLTLGSVQVETLSIMSIEKKQKRGSYLTVGDHGTVVDGSGLYEKDDSISVVKRAHFMEDVDFHGSKVDNVFISSGSIRGEDFDVDARDVKVQSLTLSPLRESKKYLRDTLAIVRDDGSLTNSNIALDESGWIDDMKISGSLHFFRGKEISGSDKGGGGGQKGQILDAAIEGGTVRELEKLHVAGPTHFGNNLDVKGDVFIDGGLTVGGSVLGSGPYIDVSDERLKVNVKPISSEGMLEKLTKLQAVHYELVTQNKTKYASRDESQTPKKKKEEVGFIAQDVEEIFPNLVSLRMDGFLGLQYSRFVPLLIEGMKDIQKQLKDLQEENQSNRDLIQRLIRSKNEFDG